jgi:hypothetical protein
VTAILDQALGAQLVARTVDASLVSAQLPAEVSQLSPAQIDQLCPASAVNVTAADGSRYRLDIPRMSALLDDLRDTGLVIEHEGLSYRVLVTWTILCADQTMRVVLLSPTPAGALVRTYEADVSHLCARFSAGWMCGGGTLGAGVPVYAMPEGAARSGPRRVALPGSLDFAGNRWTRHFAWDGVLGAISRRPATPDGYTHNRAWNVNPNDRWPDGSSKAPAYVAAIALKATTGRSGVPISVYSVNSPDGAIDVDQLNDCEPGFRAEPDLSSSGQLDKGFLVDIRPSPDFMYRCQRFAELHGLHVGPVFNRFGVEGNCRSMKLGDGAVLGLSVIDSDINRRWCPAGEADFGQPETHAASEVIELPFRTVGREARRFAASADTNGDGKSETFVIDARQGGLYHVAVGHPSRQVTRYPTMSGLESILAADLNADGVDEIVLVNRGAGISVFRAPPGVPEPPADGAPYVPELVEDRLPLPAGTHSNGATDVAAGDFDGDGRLDLVTQTGSSQWVLWLNRGSSGGVTSFETRPGHHARVTFGQMAALTASDLASDGVSEITFHHDWAVWSWELRPNNEGYWLSRHVWSKVTALAVGHFTSDGQPDIVVSGLPSFVYVANRQKNQTVSLPAHTQNLVVSDLNLDGKPDFLASAATPHSPSRGEVRAYMGWGDGTFAPTTLEQSASEGLPTAIVGQYDADPRPDVVVFATGTEGRPASVKLYLNRSN